VVRGPRDLGYFAQSEAIQQGAVDVDETAPVVLDEKIGVLKVIEKRAKGLRQRSAEEAGG
jgi:hypothetical protein